MAIGDEDVVPAYRQGRFEVGENGWHFSKIMILTDAIRHMIRAYGSHAIAFIVRNGRKVRCYNIGRGYTSYRFAQFLSLL